jgi:hypothetical protein
MCAGHRAQVLRQFLELGSEKQRESWAPLLLLLLNKINALDRKKVSARELGILSLFYFT